MTSLAARAGYAHLHFMLLSSRAFDRLRWGDDDFVCEDLLLNCWIANLTPSVNCVNVFSAESAVLHQLLFLTQYRDEFLARDCLSRNCITFVSPRNVQTKLIVPAAH